MSTTTVNRARGCLMGQLAGDALGSLVEIQKPEEIRRKYPGGLRELADGGDFNLIAGQPTDDSEMALSLARTLAKRGRYDPEEARRAYVEWLDSGAFGYGKTVYNGLRGNPISESQSNGAMMRISPLGIFGANHDLEDVAEWARQDAAITHLHPVCQQANALFTMAIAHSIQSGTDRRSLYGRIVNWAEEMKVDGSLLKAVHDAAESPPDDFCREMGLVLIALRNALWQLLHAQNLEEAVVGTIMFGGDTDTNAAICGALLGAVWGLDAIPARWSNTLLNCRPEAGQPHVHRPRPERFWPVDALELAARLIEKSRLEE